MKVSMFNSPFIDRVANKFGFVRILNTPENKEVERRLKDIINSANILRSIQRETGYVMTAVDNYMQSYFDPNPITRNKHFVGLVSYYEMFMDSKIKGNFAQRHDTVCNRPWMIRPAIENDRMEVIKAGFSREVWKRLSNSNRKKKYILKDQIYGFMFAEKILGFEDVQFEISLRTGKKKYETETITIKDALIVKDIQEIVPTAFGFDGKQNTWYGKFGVNARILTKEELVHLITSTFDDQFGSRWGFPLTVPIFSRKVLKSFFEKCRGIYIERYGVPTIDVEYPETIKNPNDPAIKKMETAAKGMQQAQVITHPVGWAIKFIEETNKAGTIDVFQSGINYQDESISELILGHRQATQATSVGSLASSTVKEAALRQAILETDAMNLDTVLSEQFVQFITDLNFPPNGRYPEYFTYVGEEKDIEERIAAFDTVSAKGGDLSDSQLRRDLHVDRPLDEDDALKPEDIVRKLQYIGKGGKQEQQNTVNGNGERKLSRSERRKLTRKLVKQLERTKDFKTLFNEFYN